MNYRMKIQLALLLFFFNNWALADQRWFQVELIIFQQQAPNTEIFEQTQSEIEPVARYARASTGSKSMKGTYSRLKRSKDYRPFYYQSWRIPVSSGRVSLPIGVSGVNENLNGWIKVQRGDLLHIIADLEYSPVSMGNERLIYSLKEKRRVLLNEVHYLDHPMFGAVVKVSPVK